MGTNEKVVSSISIMDITQQGELYILETATKVVQKEILTCVAEPALVSRLCIRLSSPLIFKIRCCAFACHKPNYPWWMLDKFLTQTNNCVDHSRRVCVFHFLPHRNPAFHHVWGCFDKINPQHADELFKFDSVMYEDGVARDRDAVSTTRKNPSPLAD